MPGDMTKKAWPDLLPAFQVIQLIVRPDCITSEYFGRIAVSLDASGVQVLQLRADEGGHRPNLAEVRKDITLHETPAN